MVGATGFEPATTCTPSGETSIATVASDSQGLVIPRIGGAGGVQPSQRITGFSKHFAANLLPQLSGGIERLLTVREVAAVFRVCSATVYKWVADGVFPHVRIVNTIRVRPADLAELVTRKSESVWLRNSN